MRGLRVFSAAYELAKKGTKVTVIESTGSVGGMAKSFELFGQIVDCGPHRFFSSDKIVNDLFHEVVQDDYTLVNRLTRIYYKNKFFDYPLKLGNVLKNLSPLEIVQILWSYAVQRVFGKKNLDTFEDWVTDKFGKNCFKCFSKHILRNFGELLVIKLIQIGQRNELKNCRYMKQ